MQIEGSNILIKANGISICYNDWGKSDIPVIFVHGFPFNKSSWQIQFDYFKSKRRVISYDIRGYGQSDIGDEELSINLFADDLIKMMDALLIEKAVLCGLSMGGYILLNAVNRYPERIHAMILCDTQCIADSPEGREKRFKAIRSIESNGIGVFAESFIPNLFSKGTIGSKPEVVKEITDIVLSASPEAVTGTLKALAERNETCSILGEIKIPVLILCGKEDSITPPAQSERLHANIKDAKYHLIEGAGHLSNMEQADQFNNRLGNFLDSV